MADFVLAQDELASVCRQLAAQTDGVPAMADQLRETAVGTADFGGTRYEAVAHQYLEFIGEVVPELLGGYTSANRSMSDRLASTLGSYASADERAADALKSIDVRGEPSGDR